ncbi:MAG: transglycosylase domain-containing protein, partial [Micromonosporaceae bacterium]
MSDISGRGSSRASGSASVGSASVGPGRGSVGRASVGAGGAAGRAQVRPGSPYGASDPYAPDPYGDPYGADPYGPSGHGRPSRLDRHRRRQGAGMAKRRKRRQRIVALGAVAVMLLGFCVLAGTYFFVNVPLPKDLANMSQNSTIEYSNGKTLAKVGTENRKYVKLDKIPKVLQHAVVATEDRSFYTNSGIDVKGIFRAAWNNLTDDDTEGASTITQQYARNAAGLEGGYSRKLKEAVMAVKINQEYTKDQILEYYLNTIFFGRNANGVGAASEAYFGKPVHKLNAAESAMLAGVIKNPSGYDAAIGGKDRAEQRWRLVLKNMTDMKFLDAGTAAKLKFPKLASADKATGAQFGLDKPQGNVTKYVIEELGKEGITEQELYNDGYTIRTTIDKRAQRAANSAIVKVLKDQKDYLTGALVAVEPGTGEVKAYWGSKNGHNGFDNAAARHQPGSSFKAYVLAAALEEGISVKSYWDGSSPQRFEGRKGEVRNADNNNSCKRCTLERATVLSLNTAYYALTEKVGKDKVI